MKPNLGKYAYQVYLRHLELAAYHRWSAAKQFSPTTADKQFYALVNGRGVERAQNVAAAKFLLSEARKLREKEAAFAH